MSTPNTPAGSLKPQPKVAAGGAAGAIALVIVWLVSLTGLEMPAEVSAAIGWLVTAGVAWLTPNR